MEKTSTANHSGYNHSDAPNEQLLKYSIIFDEIKSC